MRTDCGLIVQAKGEGSTLSHGQRPLFNSSVRASSASPPTASHYDYLASVLVLVLARATGIVMVEAGAGAVRMPVRETGAGQAQAGSAAGSSAPWCAGPAAGASGARDCAQT